MPNDNIIGSQIADIEDMFALDLNSIETMLVQDLSALILYFIKPLALW